MNSNILLCGVGGQGTVLASKLIAAAFMSCGEVVHSAETIGMAQRGGSVTSHIRIGKSASSPLIPLGKADLILAFEPAEAVRNLQYLKRDGMVIVNSCAVVPVSESLKKEGYRANEMIDYLKAKVKRLIIINSDDICKEFGSAKYFNIAMLGVAAGAGFIDLSKEALISEIEAKVPEKYIETNKKAFNKGFKMGGSYEA